MAKQVKYGTFSRVTIYDDRDLVDIQTNDYAKEAMALEWFPEHPIFPEVIFAEEGEDKVTYRMKKYDTKFIKANLDKDQWNLYKALRAIYALYYAQEEQTVSVLGALFDKHRDILGDSVTDALMGASDAMGNYGYNVGFEISPRNCAIDNGKLILLDCFFNPEQLNHVKNQGRFS